MASDIGESSTSTGRSRRNRRPPQQYSGALSWQEARQLVRGEEQLDEDVDDRMHIDSSDDEVTVGDSDDSDEPQDFINDGEAGLVDHSSDSSDSSDKPDKSTQSHRKKSYLGKGQSREEQFGSDSGEEFSSSGQSDEGGNRGVGNTPNTQGKRNELNDFGAMPRVDRARTSKWQPPHGHGGMENPDHWREAGQRNRDLQKDREGRDHDDEAVEVDFEDDELQHLADVFASEGADATIQQVERWQSALHQEDREHDEDEELDEAAFEQDLRGAMGFRRKNVHHQDGPQRRPPREQNLSPAVKMLLREANMAYVMEDLPKTIEKLEEVIKLEPAVRSAWATLALCFGGLNKPERALQCRIMQAHLTYRPIELWAELANESREMGFNEQAVYCLSKAISASREKDRVDVIDMMWERGQLLEEMDESKRASMSYLSMLNYRPQNQSIIRQLIPLLFQLNRLEKAIEILQECEDWNMKAFPDPFLDPALMDESLGPDNRYTYESSEVVTLADLLLRVSRPQEALVTIRRGARWLDGRANETFWNDVIGDDREFDESRDDEDRTGGLGRRVELAPIHYLEPEFRFQLAVARARLGHGSEACRHFDIWRRDAHLSENLEHYSDMTDELVRLASTADTEGARHKWYEEALDITVMTITERQNGPEYGENPEEIIRDYKRLATCYTGLKKSGEAIRWLVEIIQYNPDDFESMLKLAEVYETTGDRDKALELVTDVVRKKRDRQYEERQRTGTEPIGEDDTLAQSLSFFAEIQRKASRGGSEGGARASMREQRKEIERIREMESALAYRRLKAREGDVFVKDWWSVDVIFSGDVRKRGYGDRESPRVVEERFVHVSDWLSDAERLVTMFQNTSQLYPRNRTKKFSGVLRTKRKKADMVDSQATAILARLGDDYLEDGQGKDTYELSTFRGIHLEDWVTLIMQYAFVLTKVGEYDTAKEMIDRVMRANIIWSDASRKLSLQMCLASCALYAEDYTEMVEQIKTLTLEYQFHNEPLRILLTLANATGYSSMAVFSKPHNLKNFLRRSRIHEAIVQGGSCYFNEINRRWVMNDRLFASLNKGATGMAKLAERDRQGNVSVDEDEEGVENGDDDEGGGEEEGEDDLDEEEEGQRRNMDADTTFQNGKAPAAKKGFVTGPAPYVWERIKDGPGINPVKSTPPTRLNPVNDMFYANCILTSTNGVPSMGYWIRVFARQQSDPLICLTAAVACFGRAQNRQVDNRHQAVMQGFAFLDRYRQIRVDMGHSRSEVAYNFGRAFHLLGLYQLAVSHYQEVLDLHEHDLATLQKERESSGNGDGNNERNTTAQQKHQQGKAGFDAWPEAAYNLALVYLASGNTALANHVMEHYLSV